MLDRRIDYADIDNRTLFLRRDGVVVGPLTRRSMAVKDCWAYELNGMECLVRTDGSHYYGSSNYDLTSRIPTEPTMQSQVVVFDDSESTLGMDRFDSFPNGSILQFGTKGEKALKVTGGVGLRLTGQDAGSGNIVSSDIQCRPLPHLRLRMILEPKPA
jgi:hypothetical protein